MEAQGKLEQAIARYREAILLKPDLAMAKYGVGSVLQSQGKLGEAVAAYHEAPPTRSQVGDHVRELGQCEEYQGKLDQALAAYRRGQELSQPGLPADAPPCPR